MGLLKKAILSLMNATPAAVSICADYSAHAYPSKESKRFMIPCLESPRQRKVLSGLCTLLCPDQMLSRVDELADKVREILLTEFKN